MEKSSNWGSFCGAISGLSSLSLMSMVHPLVGIAAVPLSIAAGSSGGTKIGTKIGDAIAYCKGNQSRYGFGDVEDGGYTVLENDKMPPTSGGTKGVER